MKPTNKKLVIGDLSQEQIVQPFRAIAQSHRNHILEEMRTLTDGQVEYIKWMHHRHQYEQALWKNWTCRIDIALAVLWFPFCIVFQRDRPKCIKLDHYVEKRKSETEEQRVVWVARLSGSERTQAEDIYRYWEHEILGHLIHHALGHNETCPVLTAKEVESQFLAALQMKA